MPNTPIGGLDLEALSSRLNAVTAASNAAYQVRANIPGHCSRCNEFVSDLRPIRGMPHGAYCGYCRQEQPLQSCAQCASVCFADVTRHDGRYHFCISCADSRGLHESVRIFRHDYAPPSLRFAGFRPIGSDGAPELFCGIELEVEASNSLPRAGIAKTVHDVLGSEHFFSKSDGSLSDGVEIVSHPFTLQKFPFEKFRVLCDTLRKADCRSYAPGSCGLHVHVGREGLSSRSGTTAITRGSEEERTIWRGITALRTHLFNLSRRPSNERTDRYCRFPEPLSETPAPRLTRPVACPRARLTRAELLSTSSGGYTDRPRTNFEPAEAQQTVVALTWTCSESDPTRCRPSIVMTEGLTRLFTMRPVTSGCPCLSCAVNARQNRAAQSVANNLVAIPQACFDTLRRRWAQNITAPSAAEIANAQQRAGEQYLFYDGLRNDGFYMWPDRAARVTESWRSHRYQAINFTNSQTIEVRFFRGTLHPDSAVNSIKFSVELIRFLCQTSPARLALIERGKLSADVLWFELLSSLAAPLRAWVLERSATKTRYKDQARKFKEKTPARVELIYPGVTNSLAILEAAS